MTMSDEELVVSNNQQLVVVISSHSVTTEYDSTEYSDAFVPSTSLSTENAEANNNAKSDEELSSHKEENSKKEQYKFVLISPEKLNLTLTCHQTLSITNVTSEHLVLYKMTDRKHLVSCDPQAGALFPHETSEVQCLLLSAKKKKRSGYITITAAGIDSNTDVDVHDNSRFSTILDGYLKTGCPSQTNRVTYTYEEDNSILNMKKSKSDIAVSSKQSPKVVTSKSLTFADDLVTLPAVTKSSKRKNKDKMQHKNNQDAVKDSSFFNADEELSRTSTTGSIPADVSSSEDGRSEWVQLAKKEEKNIKFNLNSTHKKTDKLDVQLTNLLEEIDSLTIGADALMHMSDTLQQEAIRCEAILIPENFNEVQELKSEINLFTETINRNIERMTKQHASIWKLIHKHGEELGYLTDSLELSSQTHTKSSENTSAKDGDDNHSKKNITSNAVMDKEDTDDSSTLAVISDTEIDTDIATLNTTSNAVTKGNAYYHKVTGDREGVDNIERNQRVMNNEMKAMTSDIKKLSALTNNLLETLRKLAKGAKSSREGVLAGITAIEEKMKKAGFKVTDVQKEGDRNKATIHILKANFSAHIDKIASILRNMCREQGLMKKEANRLLAGQKKVKKNLLRLSEGISDEHRHLLKTNAKVNKRINDFSEQQQETTRILKDLHKDLRILHCKLKHAANQMKKTLERNENYRRAFLFDLQKVSTETASIVDLSTGNEDIKINKLEARVVDFNGAILELKARNEYNAKRLPEQKAALEQHLSLYMQELHKLEATFEKCLALGKEEVDELFGTIKQKMTEFKENGRLLNGKVEEYKKSVDVFKEDIAVTGSGMSKVIADLMKKLKGAAGERMALTYQTLGKMEESIKQLVSDVNFLVDFCAGINGKISDLVDHVNAKVPAVWNDLEHFIRSRHADVAVRETKTQAQQKEIMKDIKNLISAVEEHRAGEEEKGVKITKFSLKMKDFCDELNGEIAKGATQINNHKQLMRGKMYDLLRQNLNDGIKIVKDSKRSMMVEINYRLEESSKAQFKEVQIYIDRIKQRVNKTTRILQSVQTSADWVFYFLMMLLVLLGLFLFTVIALESEQASAASKPPPAKPWVPHFISRTISFAWNWDEPDKDP